jgi:hypothetical protein
MNDDLMPPDGQPPVTAVVVAPSVPSNRIKCDFCACQLAPNGDVMAMSPQARKFRDQEEKIATLHKDIVDLQEAHKVELRDLTEEVERARAVLMQPGPVKPGFLDAL